VWEYLPVLEKEPKHTTGDTEETEKGWQDAEQGATSHGCKARSQRDAQYSE